jgi:hypothetical protein
MVRLLVHRPGRGGILMHVLKTCEHQGPFVKATSSMSVQSSVVAETQCVDSLL